MKWKTDSYEKMLTLLHNLFDLLVCSKGSEIVPKQFNVNQR